MSRILVAIVIGVILALGVRFFQNFNDPEAPPTIEEGAGTAAETAADATPEAQLKSEQVQLADGRKIMLNYDPVQYAILVDEWLANQANVIPTVISVVPDQGATANNQNSVTVTPTSTPSPAATVTPTIAPITPVAGTCGQLTTRSHTVAQGDTIYRLTQMYTTSVEQLAAYGITEGVMVVGNVLNVPTTGCVCTSGNSHIVRSGQNVFRIALMYGTTKETIRDLNGLNTSYLIFPNQVLCLP